MKHSMIKNKITTVNQETGEIYEEERIRYVPTKSVFPD